MIVRRRQIGLTLVEILVSIVLLTVLLIPAMQALQTSVVGVQVHGDITAASYRLSARLEELLAEPYADLAAAAAAAGSPTVPSSYSDTAGPPGRLLVYLSLYDGDDLDSDGDPFTGTDPDLMWIRVEIENSVHDLQTVRANGY